MERLLVPDPDASVAAEANRPEPNIEYTVVRFQHGVNYTATQPDVRLSPIGVENLLVEGLADVPLTDVKQDLLHSGLADYTYDNGLVGRNADNMRREVRTGIRQMRPDMRRLVTILNDDADDGKTLVPIRVATHGQVNTIARDQLLVMKPSLLAEMCNELGVDIDELALWRQKGGDRHNRELKALYELEDLGIDSERLRRELATRLFRRIHLLSEAGIEVALVPEADLVSPTWLSNVTVGEKIKPVPRRDRRLPYFEVAFRRGAIQSRQISPVVSWAAVGEDHWSYADRRKKFTFEGSRLHFDEDSRTLTLFSPIVGAVALGRQLPLGDLEKSAYQFFRSRSQYHTRHRPRWHGQPLPPEAHAARPAIMVRRETSAALTSSSALEAFESQLDLPTWPQWRRQVRL